LPEIRYYSDLYGFYSPILMNNISFNLFSVSVEADTTPPEISNLRNTSTTDTSSYVEWDCDEACNYTITWYDNAERTAANLVGTQDVKTYQTSNNPQLTSLDAATTYYINLTVWDSSGNNATNNTLSFTTDATPPESLAINTHSSEPSAPDEKEVVYVYVNVTSPNDILYVNFSIIAPNGTVIMEKQNATSKTGDIFNSSNFTVSSVGTWTYNITAGDGSDTEEAQGTFSVSTWHTIVGNLSGSLILGNTEGGSIVQWQVNNVSGSNVYITDYDSVIDFSSLNALGRNLSNSSVVDDFEELDYIINTTGNVDSVNDSYTSEGSVKKEYNFSIFATTLYYVPIINSTNNSIFFTGILWDSSDDTGNGGTEGEFDSVDKEDVVFVTEAREEKLGRYGLYDFEINVPANLKYLVDGGDRKSVALYGELK
jgi:hypothetical protein